MHFKLIAILIVLMTINGCVAPSGSSQGPNSIAIIRNDTSSRDAETKLAEAAASVSASLRQLAEIERATHPQAKLPTPPSAELLGMNQMASVQWSGPVGQLIETIAKKTHYKLRVLGKAPAIPVLVSISAKDTSLADILRDITFQCGNKANIVPYPASRTIELRYAK